MALDPHSITKTFYRLRRLSRRLWIRVALIAGLAVIASLTARPLSPLVPDALSGAVKAESVLEILKIIASSMLAVTIFSLAVMVSARQAASSQVTPRSHQLLTEDTTTQTVLATFLGTFVFSLVGYIELGTGYYTGASATVMLAYILVVVALVVVAIVRWIDHLEDLGSVIATTRRVEGAAQDALAGRLEWPCLGANALSEAQIEIPPAATAYQAWMTGYVQHVDIKTLAGMADEAHASIYVVASPGRFVAKGAPLAWHTGTFDEDALREGFTMGDTRVFGQDPRFGVIVLGEIAQRALSPGINDPGTAIDVIGRLQRLLVTHRDEARHDRDVPFPRVWMHPVTAEGLIRDAFDPIARDGAAVVEVQLRLQVALKALSGHPDAAVAAAAARAAARAMDRAEEAIELPADMDRLRAAFDD